MHTYTRIHKRGKWEEIMTSLLTMNNGFFSSGPGAKNEETLHLKGEQWSLSTKHTKGKTKRKCRSFNASIMTLEVYSKVIFFSLSLKVVGEKINFLNCFFNRQQNWRKAAFVRSHARNESLFRSFRGKDQLFLSILFLYISKVPPHLQLVGTNKAKWL